MTAAGPVLKVLEIGHYAAGYAGRLAVRAGYDVVRIQQGKPLPAWASATAMQAYLHAGKRCVASADTALIGRLAEQADIVVCEAWSAGAIRALGFEDWQQPCKVSVTPFGLTGPYQNRPATPATLLAMGGYTQIMGDAERAPLSLPGHYLEFQSGALAFAAACAAHLAGDKSPIDIGMLEVVMALSQFTAVRWYCAGEVRQRHGSDFWSVAPSDLFRLQDGWVYINIVPNFWDAFVALLEEPALLIDERFQTNDLRMANRDALREIIARAFARRTRAQVDARAAECRVPLGVVRSLEDVLHEPHLTERGFWETVAVEGKSLRSPGLPYQAAGVPRPKLDVEQPAGEAPW